jgi:hypothetical protein
MHKNRVLNGMKAALGVSVLLGEVASTELIVSKELVFHVQRVVGVIACGC